MIVCHKGVGEVHCERTDFQSYDHKLILKIFTEEKIDN